MKILLTLVFVAAIMTLGVMNGKVQGGEHPAPAGSEHPKAEVSKEEHPKSEESKKEESKEEHSKSEEHPTSEQHNHKAEHPGAGHPK